MDIKISPAQDYEVNDFEAIEWDKVDEEHWGGPITWHTEEFYLKAEEDGSIVATIKGKLEAGVVYVDTIIVAEGQKGKGVGTQLMVEVENWAKSKNAHKVYLFTREEWKASAFYKKLGYEISGTLKNHYLQRDFVIFEKTL